MNKFLSLFARLNIFVGICLLLLPLMYLVATSTPEIWYRINPRALEDEIEALTRTPFDPIVVDTIAAAAETKPIPLIGAQPQVDTSIPRGRFVHIPTVGVTTQIVEDTNERAALDKGVWLLPGYGTPENDLDKPTILAAHRFGRAGIDRNYRNQNMFYNLPKIKIGDTISINWDQKPYKYEVTYIEESSYVSRLSDLILITCKTVNSPQRIFVYAQRVV